MKSISKKPTIRSVLERENPDEPPAPPNEASEINWNAMESRIFDYLKENNVKPDSIEQLEHRNLMAARSRL